MLKPLQRSSQPPQRNYTPQRNSGVTLGSETIRNRQYGADCQTSRKEMTRVLKPFDLQALSIFLCIKVALVTDQACGTGGMLSTGYNFIKRYNPSADVRLFGQEINPESYAILQVGYLR